MHSTATVTTANDYAALTTLDRVKTELGIVEADSDALLAAKIREASSDIFARIWAQPRETITETFWPRPWQVCGPEALVLSRRPVVSVTSVTVDGSAVDSSLYRLAAAGMLHALAADGAPTEWSIAKSVVVTYVAGYTMPCEVANYDLPPALEAACVELVSSYWLSRGRDPTVRQEDVPGLGSQTFWVGAIGEVGSLPPGVEAKIAPYKRMMIA